MRFVVDMNLSPMWIDVLERAGHNADHWVNVGEVTVRDEEILSWAARNDAVVFTNDLDFGAILARSKANVPSVLQVRDEDVMPAAMKEIVLAAITQFDAELSEGALVVVEPWRHRCRVLPLRREP